MKKMKENLPVCHSCRQHHAIEKLLALSKDALRDLDAANEVLGGWAGKGYYKATRDALRKLTKKAEGK